MRPYHTSQAARTRIYSFIVDFMTAHHGLAPTVREIMTELHIRSTNTVLYHLQGLADEQKIAYVETGRARNFYLPGATWTPPAQ